MIDPNFFKHLDRLKLIIDKKVASNYVGERESTQTGRGNTFKDHGMYTPGDDFRDIDWKVYARTDKLHIRRYEENRDLTVHIIIDYSKSMDYGAAIKKYEYASLVGLGFAYLAMKKNERFVLSTFSDTIEPFRPEKGRRKILEAMDYLRSKKPSGMSNFKGSLQEYSKRIGSRSVIIVISDFLYSPEEVRSALSGFKNNDIILIQILDEGEEHLRLKGEFALKDLETSTKIKTFIDHVIKKKYQTALDDHRRRLAWTARSIGAEFYSFSTDRLIYDVFYEVLKT